MTDTLTLLGEHAPKFVTFDSPTEGCTCGETFAAWLYPKHLAAVIDAHTAERVREAGEKGWDEGAICRAQADPATSVRGLNPYRLADGGRGEGVGR